MLLSAQGAQLAHIDGAARRDDHFWERLQQLETRHRSLQVQHERLRRDLDELSSTSLEEELRDTWKQYCEVIAELEHTTDEFITLRLQSS